MALSGYELEAVLRLRDNFTTTFDKIMGNAAQKIKTTHQTTTLFHGSITSLAAKFSVLEHAARRAVSILGQLLAPYKVTEQINMSITRMAALMTGMTQSNAGEKLGEHFERAAKYSETMVVAFQKLVPQVFGGLQEIMLVNEELTKQSLILDVNNQKEMAGFRNIINAGMTIAAGYQNREVQLRQEVRALMQGDVNRYSQLSMQLDAILGGRLKPMVEEWKRQGVLVEKVGEALQGYDAATGRIMLTWESISTTMKTTFDMAFFKAMQGPYKEINIWLLGLSESLQKNSTLIEGIVTVQWNILKETAKAFRDLWVQGLGPFFQEMNLWFVGKREENPLIAMVKVFGYLGYGVIPTVIRGFITLISMVGGLMAVAEVALDANKLMLPLEEPDEAIRSGRKVKMKMPGVPSDKPLWDVFGFTDMKKRLPEIEGYQTRYSAIRERMAEELEKFGREVDKAAGRFLYIDKIMNDILNKRSPPGSGLKTDAPRPIPLPWVPDPKDVEKYKDFLQGIEASIGRGEKNPWVIWWQKFEDGKKLLGKTKEDAEEFYKAMALLGDVYATKEYIREYQLQEKVLKMDEGNFAKRKEAIQIRAKIMELEYHDELEIKQYIAEAEKDIAEDVAKYWIKAGLRLAEERDKASKFRQEMQNDHNRYLEETYTKEDEIYTYLADKTGKYFNFVISMKRKTMKLEMEDAQLRYKNWIDRGIIEQYYTDKFKNTILDLSEANLKHTQKFEEGWRVAYERAKQNMYTWGQAGKDVFMGLQSSLESGLGNFLSDVILRTKTLKEAFRDMALSIANDYVKMATQIIAKTLIMRSVGALVAWYTGSQPQSMPVQQNLYSQLHQGGMLSRRHQGGLGPNEALYMGQVGEFNIRRGAVNSETLPKLLDINASGRDQSNGDVGGGNMTIVIQTLDPITFAQWADRNRGVFDSLNVKNWRDRGQFRRMMSQ